MTNPFCLKAEELLLERLGRLGARLRQSQLPGEGVGREAKVFLLLHLVGHRMGCGAAARLPTSGKVASHSTHPSVLHLRRLHHRTVVAVELDLPPSLLHILSHLTYHAFIHHSLSHAYIEYNEV